MVTGLVSATTYAYVPNSMDNNISVIDTATNKVIASVNVGDQPYGIAITPDGNKVYVANQVSNTVSVIDAVNLTVTATVPVGISPVGVTSSPDGTKIYVTNYGNYSVPSNTVSLINTTTNTVTATIPVGDKPKGITVSPDGTKLYVVNCQYGGSVYVIDTATNSLITTVTVGNYPEGIAITPDGTKAYVTNYDSQTVSVIDTTTNTVTATVPSVRGENIAISPDGTKIYVENSAASIIHVIDSATNNVIATLNPKTITYGISINKDGTKAYVTNHDSQTVSVIDTARNIVTDTVNVGRNPQAFGQFISPSPISSVLTGVDLSLSMQAPSSKDHGSSMTYTLYYSNSGNATVQNVTLEDRIPDNLTFESASDGGIYDPITGTVRWDIGTVEPSGSGYRTLNVSIPADVPVRTVIVNKAKISISNIQALFDNNEAQAKTTVTNSTLPPKTTPYTIDFENPSFGNEEQIKDHYPGLMFSDGIKISKNSLSNPPYWAPYSGNNSAYFSGVNRIDFDQPVSWVSLRYHSVTNSTLEAYDGSGALISKDTKLPTTNGLLQVGGSNITYVLIYAFDDGNIFGVDNHYFSDTYMTIDDFEFVIPDEGANLFLSMQAPITKDRGSSMTYMLYYSNFGKETANEVILEDKLPNNVTFESASNGGVYDSSTRTVRWDLRSLNFSDNGYRTLNVSIPEGIPVGTNIVNNANISTSNLETQYDDNNARGITGVTGSKLPPNVGVEPNNGGIGIPSVFWKNPTTLSYHNTGLPVTGVNINIHFDDGLPDITGTMTGGPVDWTYTFTPAPRNGKATVTYTKQHDPFPYTPNYDIRGHYGDKVTADEIYNYIKFLYPQSPMLSEPDIGSRFINAGKAYGIDPIFLVSMAELCSQFGTVGWGAEHPEAHNAFMYGVYGNNTTVDQVNSVSSWGDMVNRVACAIATGPNYFKEGRYTIEEICNANDNVHSSQTLSTLSPSQAALGSLNNDVYSAQTISSDSPTQAALDGLMGIKYIDTATGVGTGIHILEGYAITYGIHLPPNLKAIALLTFGMEIAEEESIKVIGDEKTEEMKDLIDRLVDTRAIVEYAQRWAVGIYSFIFSIYVDPAGYIYDVDTGQRISGASVWLQRPDGNGGWENVLTGENPPVSQPDTNPLISNIDGMYQWDTLPGSYRVHVEAPGYEPADSIVVSVPPPVFDLHVGLNHIYDPNIPPILPLANFSNDVSSGYAPLSVQFADVSESSTGINWDFGDGSSSTDRYPIHTYSTAGTYTVTLTASNGNGVNSKTGTIDVQAVPIYPVANFICNVTEGYAPLSVQFTDLSENVNEISWDFGDGTSSTDKSPVHTYLVTGNYTATLTVSNDNGTSSTFARINVSEQYVTPPQSIGNLQSSNGSTWINWTWQNPTDTDFNHTEIYLNGIFQTDISAEYFNATGLQPETDYTIGTRTVDINGNVNETWINSTATTVAELSSDVEKPVIQSVILFPANTTAGSKINITVNAKDNVGVAKVKAGEIQLLKDDNGIWRGNITAHSSVGSYSLSIKANDTAGNSAETSVPYRVVKLSGGANMAVSPRLNYISSSSVNTIPLNITVKNTQNVDDIFRIYLDVSGLSDPYPANLSWFNWSGNEYEVRAGQEIKIPLIATVPAGVTSSKTFYVKVESKLSTYRGFTSGFFKPQ
jgi:uncharacterized repeat protein (TIGR01451 family)